MQCYTIPNLGFPGGSEVKNVPAIQETQIWSLDWEDLLEKEKQPTPVFLPGEGNSNLVNIYIYNIMTKPPLPIWIKWVGVSYLVMSLCNFTNCSSSVFSVYGIIQARILEWVAIFFSTTEPKPKRKRCIVYLIAVRFEKISFFLYCNSKPKLMILKQMFSTNKKTFLFNHWTGCHQLTSVSWVDWFFQSSVISDMCSENLHCYWMISQFMGNKIRLPMYQPIQSFIPVLSGDILKYL